MRITNLILVAAIVTLAGCVPQSQYNQEAQQNQQLLYLNGTYQQLNQNLQTEVSANQVQIKQLQNRLEVTMVNSILFTEGGWEVHQQGRHNWPRFCRHCRAFPANRS